MLMQKPKILLLSELQWCESFESQKFLDKILKNMKYLEIIGVPPLK